jgi:hypothetical protein
MFVKNLLLSNSSCLHLKFRTLVAVLVFVFGHHTYYVGMFMICLRTRSSGSVVIASRPKAKEHLHTATVTIVHSTKSSHKIVDYC